MPFFITEGLTQTLRKTKTFDTCFSLTSGIKFPNVLVQSQMDKLRRNSLMRNTRCLTKNVYWSSRAKEYEGITDQFVQSRKSCFFFHLSYKATS